MFGLYEGAQRLIFGIGPIKLLAHRSNLFRTGSLGKLLL